jgi:predicted phosphodiesterase
MKVGLISDVHANLESLETAIDFFEEREISKIFCCGDIVGYGPNPAEVINRIKKKNIRSVKGNHDHMATTKESPSQFNLTAAQAIRWTRETISSSDKKFLENLPIFSSPFSSEIKASHGSTREPLWGYVINLADAYLEFKRDEEDTRYRLLGHSHIPALFEYDGENATLQKPELGEGYKIKKDKRYLINPGSIGQPRDGNWKASLAILKFEEDVPREVTFYRLNYPVEKTREKIIKANLPKELGDRLLSGK